MQYVVLYSKSVLLVTLFNGHFTFILYLTGPSIYWYIRSVLTDNHRLSRKDLWHLVPMVVYVISVIPYFVLPLSEKQVLSQEIVNDPGFLSVHNFSLLGELFTNQFLYVGRPLIALGYILWSIGMFIRFLKRKDDFLVFSHQKFMIKWLFVFFGSSFVLVASHLFLMINTWKIDSSELFFTFNTLQLSSVLGLTILLVPQNSLTFLKKCVDEGKQVDFFFYPGHEHNVRGKDRVHLNQKMVQYFQENL